MRELTQRHTANSRGVGIPARSDSGAATAQPRDGKGLRTGPGEAAGLTGVEEGQGASQRRTPPGMGRHQLGGAQSGPQWRMAAKALGRDGVWCFPGTAGRASVAESQGTFLPETRSWKGIHTS